MKKILMLIPKCIGPGNNRIWNQYWEPELEEAIAAEYWHVTALGPIVLGTIARKLNYEVYLVDEARQEIDMTMCYDIVAMYSVTPNINRCYELARTMKQNGSYVVIGGVQASICVQEVLAYADTILVGESELIWEEFLADYERGNTRKLYRQEIGTLDLKRTPITDYTLLPKNYNDLVPVQTARGCIHGCKFCNIISLYGNGCRFRQISDIAKEIEVIKSYLPNRHIYFTDDNFVCNKIRTFELLKILKEYDIRWNINADVSIGLNKELVNEIAISGGQAVLIGFESVRKKQLNHIDKHNFKAKNFEMYEKAIYNLQSKGIVVVGSFITGLDTDTNEIFDEIYTFVEKTKLSGVNITVNTPYPGTELFDEMLEANRITTLNWDMYTIFQPVIEFKNMTLDEFNKHYIQLLKRLYSPAGKAMRKRNMIYCIKGREI